MLTCTVMRVLGLFFLCGVHVHYVDGRIRRFLNFLLFCG